MQHDPVKLPELRQIPQEPNRQHTTATQQTETQISQQLGLLTELSNSLIAAILLMKFQLYSHNVSV